MKQKLLKSALIVMTVNMFLRSLGFLREIVLASVYGAGMVTDAFVISFTLPNAILAFIGASMATVYIPQYQNIKGNRSSFTSNIINLFAILGLTFSLIFTFTPQTLVYLFASRLDSATFTLASELVRIMIWSAIPILLADIYRSYLQLHDAFFQAIIANALINISVIICVIVSSIFQNLSFLAIGSVIGNFLCLFFLVAFSRRKGLKYRFYINLNDSRLKEMLHLMGPVILASAVGELNQIIDKNFASSLISGTVSSLNYASKVNGLFAGLIGSTLVTVLFPQLSELAANNDYTQLKKYLTVCVKKMIPVVLPIMIGFIILAKPIIRILFERGAFTPEDTQRTAECLQMYALCFVSANINPLLMRVFHSLMDTKTPAIISIVSIGINVVLNFLLIGSLQHRGLALATAIAAITTTIFLIIWMRKDLGSLGFASDKTELFEIILSSAIMGVSVLIGYWTLPVMTGGYYQCIVLTVGLIIAAVVIYVLMHVYFRTEYIRDIIRQVQKQYSYIKYRINDKR